MSGYVYLVTNNSWRDGVVKVGMCFNPRRPLNYRGNKIQRMVYVRDDAKAESLVIEAFRFNYRWIDGRGCFVGNIDDMLSTFDSIIEKTDFAT